MSKLHRISGIPLSERPREKLQELGTASVVVAHNHPSGNVTPSARS